MLEKNLLMEEPLNMVVSNSSDPPPFFPLPCEPSPGFDFLDIMIVFVDYKIGCCQSWKRI